jgi:hypothetical protein
VQFKELKEDLSFRSDLNEVDWEDSVAEKKDKVIEIISQNFEMPRSKSFINIPSEFSKPLNFE